MLNNDCMSFSMFEKLCEEDGWKYVVNAIHKVDWLQFVSDIHLDFKFTFFYLSIMKRKYKKFWNKFWTKIIKILNHIMLVLFLMHLLRLWFSVNRIFRVTNVCQLLSQQSEMYSQMIPTQTWILNKCLLESNILRLFLSYESVNAAKIIKIIQMTAPKTHSTLIGQVVIILVTVTAKVVHNTVENFCGAWKCNFH